MLYRPRDKLFFLAYRLIVDGIDDSDGCPEARSSGKVVDCIV